MPNELSGEESDINGNLELPLPLTTLAKHGLQVVRKLIRKQPEIRDFFCAQHY
jgi:hypothetical protein